MKSAKVKVAVSLDPELVDAVRARVRAGDAASVSAYVQRAIAGQLAAEVDVGSAVEEMLAATGGPPTASEREAALALLAGQAT